MNSSDKIQESRAQALDRLVFKYYEALERGSAPTLESLIAENAEFATELHSFFNDIEHLDLATQKPSDHREGIADSATDGSNSQVVTKPLPSRFIRDYELLRKLGEGGMGTVYLAMHTQLEKQVAIKLLKGDRGRDPKAIQRFRREIKAVGRFDHDHIVRALDAGESDGLYYLVMELIDGVNLSELLLCGPRLTITDACELTRQAAVGLDHAHQFGLIHRDVKPSNLMLTPSGTVKLLDLGLAQLCQPAHHDSTRLTIDGQAIGTLKYMAPEQFEDGRTVEASCDVFSLGVTLFELLHGELPASGVVAGIEGSSLPEIRSDLPAELVQLIRSMTAIRPSERIQSADEVAERLGDWTGGNDLIGLVELHQRCHDKNRPLTLPLASPPAFELERTDPVADIKRKGRRNAPTALFTVGLVLITLVVALFARSLITEDGATLASAATRSIEPEPLRQATDIVLETPAHSPVLPTQQGAWAEFKSVVVIGGGDEGLKKAYEVKLRCLNSEIVDGKEHRWIQVEIRNSEYAETAWVLIDADLYRKEQEFLVRDGYIEAKLPTDSPLNSIIGPAITVRWEDARDGLEAVSEDWEVQWPASRISTASVLSMVFDLSHPAVEPQFRDIRSRLGASTRRQIDESSFTLRGSVPCWKITATPDSSDPGPAIRYTIERAQDDTTVPFSFLNVDIEYSPLRLSFTRSKDGMSGSIEEVDRERLEFAVEKLAALSPGESQDYSRASLPNEEGEWARYAGTVIRGFEPEMTIDVQVRAGAQEQVDGRPCRWIEVNVNSGRAGTETRWDEAVCLLVDERAYRDERLFKVERGWHALAGEVFEFQDVDITRAEQLLGWLQKTSSGDRFRVHEALTVLFNASFRSATQLQDLRLAIQGSIIKTKAQRVYQPDQLTSRTGKSVFGGQWFVAPNQASSPEYTIQWSHEVPFGFGNVKFAFPQRFEINTELEDFGTDHPLLLGTPQNLAQRAEDTGRKLAKRDVRSWSVAGREVAVIGRYDGYVGDSVRIEVRDRFGATRKEEFRFAALADADKQWIYESQTPRKWKSYSELYTTTAALLDASGSVDERPGPLNRASIDLKVVLLLDKSDWLSRGDREEQDWRPTRGRMAIPLSPGSSLRLAEISKAIERAPIAEDRAGFQSMVTSYCLPEGVIRDECEKTLAQAG